MVTTTANPSVGLRVKALREAMDLSLRDLAERSGVSAPMLSQVERGETSPTLQIATRIAHGLELRLSQLLAPATRIPLAQKIGDDMARFLAALASDTSIDPKILQIGNVTVAALVARIAQAYELDLP